jgi:hypothetical protein
MSKRTIRRVRLDDEDEDGAFAAPRPRRPVLPSGERKRLARRWRYDTLSPPPKHDALTPAHHSVIKFLKGARISRLQWQFLCRALTNLNIADFEIGQKNKEPETVYNEDEDDRRRARGRIRERQ